MKLGKIVNGSVVLVEVEGGKEFGGQRTEAQLIADGFKTACPYLGSEDGEKEWKDYGTCIVEELVPEAEPEPEVDPDEISAEEALDIIVGGTE